MIVANLLPYAAFALVCLTLLTLPFVPAFREWRRPTDRSALPVAPNYASDIDHFAGRLRTDALAKLGRGEPTGHEDFDFVPDPVADMNWEQAGQRLIAKSSIDSSEPIRSPQPIYVEGGLRAAGGSVFSAVYATGDVHLGEQSEINDWAHADGSLYLGANSIAVRRISAGTAVELGNDTWFERMHAPTLRFGSGLSSAAPVAPVGHAPASFMDLPGAVQQTPSLFLIRGDCALEAGKLYQGSLVVTGFLTVAAGTNVIGDIKAREGASIGPRASVQGALICEKRVYLFTEAQVWGPLVSEGDILIGTRAVVGQLDGQTTVSARNIIIEDGAVVHGEVWAHEIGMVKAV